MVQSVRRKEGKEREARKKRTKGKKQCKTLHVAEVH